MEQLSIIALPFMQQAMFAAAITSIVCGLVGVFVVLRGTAFLGEGISHSALTGVALGLLLGVDPLLSALIVSCLIALAVARVSQSGKIREDTATGIFFSASLAIGILVLSQRTDLTAQALGLLFGSILTVESAELWRATFVAALILCTLAWFRRAFFMATVDPSLARLVGIPVTALHYLLFLLIGFTCAISLKLVGSVLVSSLLVAPAATALLLVRELRHAFWLSPIIGFIAAELGLVLSALIDTPPGATIALGSAIIFLIAFAVKSLKAKVWGT